MKKFAVVLLALVAAGSLAANVLLFQRYSTRRPLLRVGSEVITRKEYQDALEYQAGKPVLNKIVYAKIVAQAAKKSGVTPTDKDVDARIADIERRTPQVLENAKRDPVKMEQLRRDLTTDIALENLRVQNIKVSEAEIAAFYARNKSLFAVPQQTRATVVVAKNAVDASTAATLLQQNTPPGVIARQPRLSVVGVNGFTPNWQQLTPEARKKLTTAVFRLAPGQVTTVPLSRDIYIVVRTSRRDSAGVPPLSAVKDQVARVVKMQKSPRPDVTLARLYKEANVKFEVDRYAGYFADMDALSKNQRTASAR